MEARRISSRATQVYKVGSLAFVSLWLLFSIFAIARSNDPTGLDLLFPIIGLALFLTIYALVGRAKEVELAGDVFVVSSGGRSVEIDIRDVESVGGSRFTNPERMWLDLRRPSEFGSRIHFLPPQRWFNLFSQHPLIAELRSIVEHGNIPGRAVFAQADPRPLRQRIAIVAAGFLAFVVVLAVIVIGTLQSSDPYERAVAAVQTSPAARHELGAPIEPGWYVMGSIKTAGSSGRSTMEFPVSGARSEGTVRLSATREAGVWAFQLLELRSADRTIDLLNDL